MSDENLVILFHSDNWRKLAIYRQQFYIFFTSYMFLLHLWSSVDPDFCISLVWNEAVFLLQKHSSPRKVKQKKQEKKHQILSFKLLLQEIQLKNSNIKKVFWNSNI